MKWFFITLAAICLFPFSSPLWVHAQGFREEFSTQLDATVGERGADIANMATDPRIIAATVIRRLLELLGTLLLAYLIYGGYLILTSAGVEEQVTKGKATILHAIIGLVIILSSYGITMFATRFASGDAARQGDYVEIRDREFFNPDPLNQNTTPFTPFENGGRIIP